MQEILVPFIGCTLLIGAIVCVIGALMGNRIMQVLVGIGICACIINYIIEYWQEIVIGLGFVLFILLALFNSGSPRGSLDNKSSINTDYRTDTDVNAMGNKDYAIIRYKSNNTACSYQTFYEFKAWAPHVKDAPKSIFVKAKNNGVCTADYFDYQIISSTEYNNSNLPSSDYTYYSRKI